MLVPVAAFLLWLFWFTAPGGRLAWQRHLDVGLAGLSCLLTLGVFFGIHASMDIQSLDESMIVVALSYLTFIAAMGASWFVRWRLQSRQPNVSRRAGDGPE